MKNLSIDDFTIITQKNVTAYLKDYDFLQKLDKKSKILAEGRGFTAEIDGYVIRFYFHGGIFRNFLKDNFLSPRRYINELKIHNFLYKNSVNVPEPIGVIFFKTFIFYRGIFITRKIVGAEDLVKILLKQKKKIDEIFFEIGKIVKKIHDLNVIHGDLHLKNFLIEKRDKVYLIDFDKSYMSRKFEEKLKNILRFLRSIYKFNHFHGEMIKIDEINAFLDGYELSEDYKKELLNYKFGGLKDKISWMLNKPLYLKRN